MGEAVRGGVSSTICIARQVFSPKAKQGFPRKSQPNFTFTRTIRALPPRCARPLVFLGIRANQAEFHDSRIPATLWQTLTVVPIVSVLTVLSIVPVVSVARL